ncbi:MAG: aminotransferase class I/II-fold pyridoxal phosphate-dependent enzyme, partial [Gemmatimonadota bacterium]
MEFSSNIAALTPSATLALAARARRLRQQGVPVIDLSAGEPQYPTPAYAADAGIASVRAGKTGYPPTQGLPELREAIAAYLAETTTAGPVDPARVLVSAGVKQALFNCCFSLFGPGDEVLVLAPYWPSYPAIVELSGARPVIVETSWQEGFVPRVETLEAARTPRTRGLLVNSPGNPTGAVYDAGTMAALVAWCGEHGIWLLSDEIYRPLSYGDPAPSLFDVRDLPERVVLLDGVSKTFCMPGWRIGYAVGPGDLIARASDLQ